MVHRKINEYRTEIIQKNYSKLIITTTSLEPFFYSHCVSQLVALGLLLSRCFLRRAGELATDSERCGRGEQHADADGDGQADAAAGSPGKASQIQ